MKLLFLAVFFFFSNFSLYYAFSQANCGDGTPNTGEGCDDRNNNNGDGCSDMCSIELGWNCTMATSTIASICTENCGDSRLVGSENCDDGNVNNGDGCDINCNIEAMYTCLNNQLPSTCFICGNGERSGEEPCDDGNTVPSDGCSANCTIEEGYQCPNANQSCIPICGDGIQVTLEACDDGNRFDNDGCSSNCSLIENGFECPVAGQPCTRINNSGFPTGAIAGIVIAIVCCIYCVFVLFGALVYLRRRNRVEKIQMQKEHELQLSQFSQLGTSYVPDLSEYDEEPNYNILPTDDWEIPWSEITLGRELGRGSFGLVRKGVWKETLVAIKTLQSEEKITEISKKEFQSELEVMQKLRPYSINIVALLGFTNDPESIVVEYVSGGDLKNFLKTEQIPVSKYPKTALSIIEGVCNGMEHLHQHDVVHRDLAARNILLTKNLVPKVSDFGLARLVQEDTGNYTKADGGPLKWMAPECVFDRKYSKKSDLWSFAILLAEIYTRVPPYYGLGLDGLQIAGKVGAGKLTHPIPSHMPEKLQKIMKDCQQFHPKDRPTFSDLLPIVKSINQVDLPDFPPFDLFAQPDNTTKTG